MRSTSPPTVSSARVGGALCRHCYCALGSLSLSGDRWWQCTSVWVEGTWLLGKGARAGSGGLREGWGPAWLEVLVGGWGLSGIPTNPPFFSLLQLSRPDKAPLELPRLFFDGL